MIPVTLYTKAGCTLCDNVKKQLAMIVADNASLAYMLTEIDITRDAELFARYRFSIPVVQIGATRLKAPISPAQLAIALGQAAADAASR